MDLSLSRAPKKNHEAMAQIRNPYVQRLKKRKVRTETSISAQRAKNFYNNMFGWKGRKKCWVSWSTLYSPLQETLFCDMSSVSIMKVVNASYQIPGMTREEAERFLESKLNLQIATIDEQGGPNIQPVWFYYDKDAVKLFITTSKLARKTQNLRRKPALYFSIDDENPPYKGVKGKGIATIVEDPNRIVPQADRISMKYLGTLDHPVAKMITDGSKKGEVVIVEISPKFFSTWDYGKMEL